MLNIGIDPGKKGAIALLNGNGNFVSTFDIPLTSNNSKGKTKQTIDVIALFDLLTKICTDETNITIERTHAWLKMGAAASFSSGRIYGSIIAVSNCIPQARNRVRLVSPQEWKRYFDLLGTDKKQSKLKVMDLFGLNSKKIGRVDEADAILIAEYGRIYYV